MTPKRAFDLALALALAVPATPLVLIAAVPAWIEARAFPIFVQTRVGRGGRLFRIAKLRTMYASTLHAASHEVSRSQITRSGAFFRKTKIDELPQLWNILLGEMSFVGPRPCLPSQTELIRARQREGVYALRPGLTGPAQVRGIDMSTPQELAVADAEYCGSWSVARDIQLLIMTATGAGQGDAARS